MRSTDEVPRLPAQQFGDSGRQADDRAVAGTDDADGTGEAAEQAADQPAVLITSAASGSALAFGAIVEEAWNQGFRVEESGRGWYFYPPGSNRRSCGIARAQEDDPRVLRSLVKTLREAGLRVTQPQGQPDALNQVAEDWH